MVGAHVRLPVVLMLAGLAAACSPLEVEPEPSDTYQTTKERAEAAGGSMLGDEIVLFGGPDKPGADAGGIGVNSFLWRASLDTISFMPVAAADPFGGVILTDWYSPAEAPSERFKLNVYILGRALRADGIRVGVFRQVEDGASWRYAPVAENTNTQIEDAILTRARQLRHETLVQ